MNKRKWEAICKRCGLCCHEKLLYDDKILYFVNCPCEYLDKKKRICSVYENRFKVCKECRKVNLFRAMFASYLPSCCAYVKWAKRYHIRFAGDRMELFEYEQYPSIDDVRYKH